MRDKITLIKNTILIKAMPLRRNVLKFILNTAGIKEISGHWIYVKDIKPGALVIDLGANQGEFSKKVFELWNSKSYAVEPNTDLYNKLNREYCNPLHYAVTSTNGPVEFFISNNSEASSLIKDFENVWGGNKKVTIEGITYNKLINTLNASDKKVDILKIDIEGAELDLIESLTSNDCRNIRQITIELHDWLNKDLHERTVNCMKKLVSLGFQAYTDYPSHDWPVEILFLNKKLINLNVKDKLVLSAFRKLAFLQY